ncbi:hypothetical protein [Streptomyces sp. NPDC101234]|uniref:hypothetical protein n=1 Tax=Streptomyces sp. NPDC101234 TaxID=3366138 RepID=UPI003800BAB6
MPDGKGVGVVFAQHSHAVVEQVGERGGSPCRITGLPLPMGRVFRSKVQLVTPEEAARMARRMRPQPAE